MAAGTIHAHSTLEVAAHSTLEPDLQRPPYSLLSDPGKQVDQGCGKQEIEGNGGLEVDGKKDLDRHDINFHQVPTQRLSTRRIIVYGAIGLIIILAAVLGGVFGSRHKRSATPSLISPSNSSAPSPSVTPAQRKIAAVSFTSNSANNTRVYFQDNVGQIIEASNSASNTTWSTSRIGIGGKNGSAVAAAVSRPGLPLEITVFYLDVNNLIHDISYTDLTGSWTSGTLSAQGYTAMPNSTLSAMYNWCGLCANTTIIAFQDKNGFVQIGNYESGDWTLKQLGQDLQPQLGTGLALQPFYRRGLRDQVNLYYQKSNLNLALASSVAGDSVWSLNEQIYDPIPAGSPIAAASSYSNVSAGYETWIEVLYLSNTGVEVNTWSGVINDWLARQSHPSVMANSTSNMRIYEGVAVTAIGNGFSVVKQDGKPDAIEGWQVTNDLVDWTLMGNVDLNGAWE